MACMPESVGSTTCRRVVDSPSNVSGQDLVVIIGFVAESRGVRDNQTISAIVITIRMAMKGRSSLPMRGNPVVILVEMKPA